MSTAQEFSIAHGLNRPINNKRRRRYNKRRKMKKIFFSISIALFAVVPRCAQIDFKREIENLEHSIANLKTYGFMNMN